MPTDVTTMILCRRCALREVAGGMDFCWECMQELIEEGWQRWFEARAKD